MLSLKPTRAGLGYETTCPSEIQNTKSTLRQRTHFEILGETLFIYIYTVVANFPKAMCNLQTRENEHKLKCRIVNALSLRVVLGNNLCQLVYLQNSQKAFSLITTQWIQSCLYIQILYFLFLPQITKHIHLILISTYVFC